MRKLHLMRAQTMLFDRKWKNEGLIWGSPLDGRKRRPKGEKMLLIKS